MKAAIPTITFDRVYKKMPHGLAVRMLFTWVKNVAIIDYDQLTPEQIKNDTEAVSGPPYQLPKTRLIWVKLWSDTVTGGVEWSTLRRYTPEKWDYYSRLVGKEVNIDFDHE